MQLSNDFEYSYYVDVVASEAFVNLMTRFGVSIHYYRDKTYFTSASRLDMKTLMEKGFIRSYRIVKCAKSYEVVEEG
jgi:hypothetical protein